MTYIATRNCTDPSLRLSSPAKVGRGLRHFGKVSIDHANLTIKPALTHQQRLASIALVRQMYARRGYLTEFANSSLEDSNKIALTAWQDTRPVATLALGRDSRNGLLADVLYPEEIERLRKPGRVLCELSRLAVDPEYSSLELLRTLFETAHSYGRAFFGATDAVIEVNPRHSRYYVREFGFRQIGGVRHCPRVAAPAVLLHRSLRLFAPLLPNTAPAH